MQPNPLRGMEVQRNFTKSEQSGHAQGLNQRSNVEVLKPKIARPRNTSRQSRRRCVRPCR